MGATVACVKGWVFTILLRVFWTPYCVPPCHEQRLFFPFFFLVLNPTQWYMSFIFSLSSANGLLCAEYSQQCCSAFILEYRIYCSLDYYIQLCKSSCWHFNALPTNNAAVTSTCPQTVRRQVCGIMFHVLFATYEVVVGVLCWIWWFVHHCFLPNNNNVHLSCAHQHPERSHDTRYICLRCENLNISVYNACTTCMCTHARAHTHTHTHTHTHKWKLSPDKCSEITRGK